MMPESLPASEVGQVPGKPFPWRCLKCRKKAVWPVTIAYTTKIKVEGQVHSVQTPNLVVPRCQECGELHFDNHAAEQTSKAVRAQLHLLLPEQIRANRLALGLNLEELASRLGVAAEPLADWEQGLVHQPRAVDNLLRAFFALADVRSALSGSGRDPEFGTVVASSSRVCVS